MPRRSTRGSKKSASSSSRRRRGTGHGGSRRLAMGRGSSRSSLIKSMLSSKGDIELDAILGALMPQLVQRIGSMTRGEREALGFAKFVEDPDHPAWSMQLNVTQPKGYQAPFTERFDTIEGVTKLLKRLVNDEQGKLYDRVYASVVGGGRGAKSAQDVFAEWAKSAKISEGAAAKEAAIQTFLNTDAPRRAEMAKEYEAHKAAVEAAKAAKGPVQSKKDLEAAVVQDKKKEKDAQADVKAAEAKLRAASTTEDQAAAQAELDAAHKALQAAIQTRLLREQAINDLHPGRLDMVGLAVDIPVIKGSKDGEWTPYFTEDGYLCSPTVEPYKSDNDGRFHCVLDTGESGTNWNAKAAKADHGVGSFREIESTSGEGLPTTRRMPEGWGEENTIQKITNLSPIGLSSILGKGWDVGTNSKAIRQPAVTMKDGEITVDTTVKEGDNGWIWSLQHDNAGAFKVSKTGMLNGRTVYVTDPSDPEKIVATRLPCDPKFPVVNEDGYICRVHPDVDPALVGADGKLHEHLPTEDAAPGIYEYNGELWTDMPAKWTPFTHRAEGQGFLKRLERGGKQYYGTSSAAEVVEREGGEAEAFDEDEDL